MDTQDNYKSVVVEIRAILESVKPHDRSNLLIEIAEAQ